MKSLLQTPLVKKKSPVCRPHVALAATPHSILKVRKPQIKPSPNNMSGRLTPTPRLNTSTGMCDYANDMLFIYLCIMY